MKNILLPTDFSENAQTAARYAAVLARQCGARLIILHVFSPFATLASLDEDSDDLELAAQAKLDAKAHELHEAYGISITRLLKPGFAPDEVLALARRVKASLIVLGAQGATHSSGNLMGKVAIELLASEEFPILCIPALHGQDEASSTDTLLFEKQSLCNQKGQKLLTKLEQTFEL
ncbi:universal stress protein [Cesiribacter andamanensis]|uniref:Universal stress protein family protein n=1 Tax=Cesiribacter andamanensis AMV16 TaxID=1279009 RepID=M7NRY2_9BACT|nr:universal stress protein [Cesiribacter andamanensis]EMR01234.1 Universal stress protein family protein [Cesiribacter andamanensis AMV16]